MRASPQRVVAVFNPAKLAVPFKADFFYPLLIVIRKMLHHAIFILTARDPPEPVVVQLQPVEAQQQVVPRRVTVFFGAVARRVLEEAFFLLRFDGLCDLPAAS